MRRTPALDRGKSARLALTPEGVVWTGAAFLLGMIGWWKSINLVFLLAYLMMSLLIVNCWFARAQVRRVNVTRHPLPPALAGEQCAVILTVVNDSVRAATVSIEETSGERAASWLVYSLPGGECTTCSATQTFKTRGRFLANSRATSGFPFGLVKYDRPVGSEAEFIVLPAAGHADADLLRRWVLRQAAGDGRGRKVLRRLTNDQADVRGVRPYRPGDPIRGVHWRTSARRGELMVREYDSAPTPDLILVVEPWLPSSPTDVDRANLEAALSMAVTVAFGWNRTFNTRVTVALAGDPASVRTSLNSDASVRESLVPLAAVAGGNEFAPLAPGSFGRPLARAARVVVSSSPGSAYAAALARMTGRPFHALTPHDRPAWYHPPAAPKSRLT